MANFATVLLVVAKKGYRLAKVLQTQQATLRFERNSAGNLDIW